MANNDLREKLEAAGSMAQKGDAFFMETYLNLARRQAQEMGSDISTDVARIERLGYTNAVPIGLKDAEESAREGRAALMEITLERVRVYAGKIGRDISDDARRIERIGYEAAITTQLEAARSRAQKGERILMHSAINLAYIYAMKVNVDIRSLVAKIIMSD